MFFMFFNRLALERSAHEITIPGMPLQDDRSLTSKAKIIRTCDPKSNIGNPRAIECMHLVSSNQDASNAASDFHSLPTNSNDGTEHLYDDEDSPRHSL